MVLFISISVLRSFVVRYGRGSFSVKCFNFLAFNFSDQITFAIKEFVGIDNESALYEGFEDIAERHSRIISGNYF